MLAQQAARRVVQETVAPVASRPKPLPPRLLTRNERQKIAQQQVQAKVASAVRGYAKEAAAMMGWGALFRREFVFGRLLWAVPGHVEDFEYVNKDVSGDARNVSHDDTTSYGWNPYSEVVASHWAREGVGLNRKGDLYRFRKGQVTYGNGVKLPLTPNPDIRPLNNTDIFPIDYVNPKYDFNNTAQQAQEAWKRSLALLVIQQS